jgi:hypothetical protein
MDGGSSEWSYFTPYEADISAALQRLRENVFACGDYMTEESDVASYRHLQATPHASAFKPASIEELLEQDTEESKFHLRRTIPGQRIDRYHTILYANSW